MPQHRIMRFVLAAGLTLAGGAQATDPASDGATKSVGEDKEAPAVDQERMRELARAYMAVSSLKSEKAEEAETVVDPDRLDDLNARYRERKHEVVQEYGFEDFASYEALLKRVEADPQLRKRLAEIIVKIR